MGSGFPGGARSHRPPARRPWSRSTTVRRVGTPFGGWQGGSGQQRAPDGPRLTRKGTERRKDEGSHPMERSSTPRRRARALRRSLALSVAAGLTLGAVSSAQASFPGANGKIAVLHTHRSPAERHQWTVNPDGTGLTQLTADATTSATRHPEWSRTARRSSSTSNRGVAGHRPDPRDERRRHGADAGRPVPVNGMPPGLVSRRHEDRLRPPDEFRRLRDECGRHRRDPASRHRPGRIPQPS